VPPAQLATALAQRLAIHPDIKRAEAAGPGFVNLFLENHVFTEALGQLLDHGPQIPDLGQGMAVLIEFVSANPTGPLHVGHGRGAAFGATMANILSACGHRVTREYYINDTGLQMDCLALSIWLHYLEVPRERWPQGLYQGDYIAHVAAALHQQHGTAFQPPAMPDWTAWSSPDDTDPIDRWLRHCRELLGQERFAALRRFGREAILADIREDLASFGVTFDQWRYESELVACGAVDRALDRLQQAGHAYERDDALWFAASRFGDEEDRVLRRANGETTYFARDIAYHLEKLERNYQHLINVWGADHHGYVARLKGALRALGAEAERLEVILVQFATMVRGGEKISMSTRSGTFVPLRSFREEVGRDAARYFYMQRAAGQHLEFDVDLARSRSSDNPVYTIQYAHARIVRVFEQAAERGYDFDPNQAKKFLGKLREPQEQQVQRLVTRYPEILETACQHRAPQGICQYLLDLAHGFHAWYNAHVFLTEDDAMRHARLGLCRAVQLTLQHGLELLGVDAPQRM
jgi:arginyl-tRNA synthetase